MDSPGEQRGSLTERYKIDATNDDARNWASLLDFESPIKVESDWYSTQTFQMFLDALDINQPTTLGRANTHSNTAINASKLSVNSSHDDKQSPSNLGKDNKKATEAATASSSRVSKQRDKIKSTPQTANQSSQFETILSAEALKILSELPDLSHMSATRSFIFPPASATTTSKSTIINPGKR